MSNVRFPSLHLRTAPSVQLSILPSLAPGSSPGLTSVMLLLSRSCCHQADQPWLSHLSPSAASSPFADSSPHLTKVFPWPCPSLFLLLHLRLPQTDIQLGCLIPSPTPPSLNPKSSMPSPYPSNSPWKLSSQLREPCIHQAVQHSARDRAFHESRLSTVSTAPRSSASFSQMSSVFILLLFHPP